METKEKLDLLVKLLNDISKEFDIKAEQVNYPHVNEGASGLIKPEL